MIRVVVPQDAGLYVCSANSTAGAATLEVEVRVATQLTAHIVPPSLRVDFGAPAKFDCVTSVEQVKNSIRISSVKTELPKK